MAFKEKLISGVEVLCLLFIFKLSYCFLKQLLDFTAPYNRVYYGPWLLDELFLEHSRINP